LSRKKDRPSPLPPFNNPFGALEEKRGDLPAARGASDRTPSLGDERKGPARAVVRYERKGRGGKEVTVVEHLDLPTRELEPWLKALKKGLGCGGVVEDGNLVLQGDQRQRLRGLLAARGVRKVIVSG
jgi:translation initiation factor 1